MEGIADDTGNVPAALLRKPKIPEHLHFYLQAFYDLTNDRTAQDGFVGTIPFAVIDQYAARFGIADLDEFERFYRAIQAMDFDFTKHHNSKPGKAA